MPEWIQINSIEADPHNDGGCYVAATMYKSGDFTPYLYRTKDYGQTWTLITKGIEAEHFTRVVRADPKRPGLLYAGTESGMYISFDDGANWQPFQLNLPIVPITDLTIKNDNLIVATQGRSLWLIDDLTPLHQLNDNVAKANMHLYQPLAAYRMEGGQSPRPSKTVGMNHPNGVMVHYFIKEMPDTATVTLAFKELDGDVIKTYSNKAKERKEKLEVKKGANMFVWDTRYPDGKDFEGMILWWASLSGAKALPGKYKVALTVNGQTQEQEFEILKDPRSEVSASEMVAQFDFIKSVNEKVSEAHQSIKDIQTIRKQLKFYTERMEKDPQYKDLLEKAKSIDKAMTEVEETLYQTKNRSNQDPLNFPIRLTNKLAHLNALMREGDYGPTQQALQVRDELTREIDKQLDKFNLIKSTDLPAFNRLIKQTDIEAIRLEGE